MKKEVFYIFVLILIINICNFVLAEEKISSEIYKGLEKNETVDVIVKIKDNSALNVINDSNITLEERYKNYVYTEASLDEIKKFENSDKIDKVYQSHKISAFLQDSVPLINASTVWPIKINNFNITGINETVCIIDTGANFMHPDLIGKNKSCVVDCFNKGCVENCSIADDNGHGTHVAGIVAASGIINGVAINTNLIAVKVLNASGSGSGNDLDLSRAIDYCASQNVSVISMSLGTEFPDLYTNDCSSLMGSWTDSIDNATAKNISVIIATGNGGSSTSISAPACIKNAIAVAATNKDDTIASYSNRNNLTDLVAPGTSISSTSSSGGYVSYSGTSMATPHVAGAFALIREFFRLQYNRNPTTLEILGLLNSTGKQINDTAGNGLNYSRIDVYSALISNDSSNPSVNLTSPTNATTQFNTNITFRCNANDVLLSNLSLYVWNSSNAVINTTNHTTIGINADEQFNLNLNYGEYKWNCLAYDHKSKSNFFSSNYSLIITSLNVNLNSPLNNSYVNQNQTFNCSAETESSKSLKNITFFVWNSSQDLVFNLTQNILGISNYSLFNYNFTNETNYFWNCKAFNNNSNSTFASSNFTITYDITKPNITIINPADSSSYTSNSQSIIFSYNVSDNLNIANCSLIVNNTIVLTNSSITNLSESQSFTNSFSPGNYNWSVNCTDSARNTENSSLRSFVITSPLAPVVVSTSSAGGGGSPSYNIYSPNISEIQKGYTKELNKNDKIQFVFFDAVTIKHTLIINEIKNDYVNITIRSNPINLLLGIGQSVKLNLSSSNYYDLLVKLDSIENNKAKLTIQTIHEEIPKPKSKILGINESKEVKEYPKEENKKENIDYLNKQIKIIKISFLAVVIIFIIIIVLILLIKRRNENKKKKNKIQEYKATFERHLKPR